jgi:hypothetical protein
MMPNEIGYPPYVVKSQFTDPAPDTEPRAAAGPVLDRL